MKRNPAGSGTADLADGFKTISDADIKAKAISVEKGNLFNTTAMTGVNAVDAVEAFYDHADAKLQGINTYMFMNSHELTLYRRCYRDKYGTVNWNNEFNHNKMDGASNCTLVGLDNVPKGYKIITPGSNMANFGVEDSLDSHFLVDFIATMYFGTQFETISKERILFGYDTIPAE